jgi:drug/metabolite transporter (DMT)-like permease
MILSPTLQMHLLVFLLALTGVFGQLLSLNTTSLVAWRTGIAALVMALWLLIRRKAPLRTSPAEAKKMLGIGVLIGAHWLFFYGSLKVSNISICLTGFASISLFTAFTEPWLNGTKVVKSEVILGILVAIGLALIAGFETQYLLGLTLAIIGAFLASIFPVLNRRLVLSGTAPETILLWEMPGACLAALLVHPLLAPYATLFHWQPMDFLWMFFLAIVCTVFAHAFHTHLLKKVTAYTCNLLMNFEPIHGIILGALLFHDYHSLRPAFYAGAAIIILSNFLHLRLNKATSERITSA